MENPEICLDDLARLSKMLKWKKSRKFYAERLGVSEKKIRQYLKQLKTFKVPDRQEWTKEEDFVKGTLRSERTASFEPNSHKELAIIHNVDLDVFQITNYWSKLQPNGNYTSSIFCRRKQPQDYSIEDFKKFLKDYKSNYIPVPAVKHLIKKETVDLELSISDFHLAKKYVDEKNLNVEKRAEKFFGIAEKLITRSANYYNIDTIVFPISNDFFHTDTYWNTSTKGTPQDVIAEYDKEYEVGFDVLVRTIQLLLKFSNKVKVVLVPGNHDRTKSFYLAHALNVFFKSEDRIQFIRDKDNEKAVVIGNTFIGYHHGNCKLGELPMVFATHPKYSEKFGKAKYREIHTGDKHHYMAKEEKGVRIQQMPSMSGADRWHKDNHYVHNIRAALLLMYDRKKGKIGELEERI